MSRTIFLLLLLTVGHVSAQNLDEILNRSDKRTAMERAQELYRSRQNDSLAIALVTQWLHVIPKDTAALTMLADLHKRSGDTTQAKKARTYLDKNQSSVESVGRVHTIRAVQRRLGTYKVMLPAKVDSGATYPAILLLHGNGNNSDLMLRWARSLGLDSVIFIVPEAPYMKVVESFNTHSERYSASGDGLGLPDSSMADIVAMSASWYFGTIDDARTRYPISPRKPLIIGFSQGGFYSYVIGTRYPQDIGGIVSICASMYDYGNVKDKLPLLKSNAVPVLITHGVKDTTVPYSTAELIDSWLKGAGVSHELIQFDGGHWPSKEVTITISDWLKKRL